MGFYFRKSFGKGLFRINLSKSGVSYSVGVKGARVRFGSKGTYVSLRSHGISYQKKIAAYPSPVPDKPALAANLTHTITSGAVESITDVDSEAFIQELKEKEQKLAYYKTFGIYPMAVCLILLFYAYFNNGLYDKYPTSFWISFGVLGAFFLLLLPWLKKLDADRLMVEIYYDMDDQLKEVYTRFTNEFSRLLGCKRVWQYLHAERTNDYKYSSGASFTVSRKPLMRILTSKSPSKVFKTNVQIPYLGLVNTELYFFPERLIIKRGNQFGAIMYKNIDCYSTVTRFIESESLPSDAQVVGHTWRYLNKNGTPDRRFNNNYQLPICHYSEYSFTSSSGLNEKISTSKAGSLDDFLRLIQAIGQLQRKMAQSHLTH